jgi:hypothetical protein
MMHIVRLSLIAAAALILCAPPASAQPQEPIGPFAADVRVAVPNFNEDADIAGALGVGLDNLPGRGLGLSGGAHWYLGRLGRVTLGLGGEILIARGSRTLEPADEGGPEGPSVTTRVSVVSPQVSLNFGTGRGWSYVTAGLGWAGFRTERADDPVAAAPSRPRVLNYGGGARWFAKEHLAFTVDLRFYAVNAQEAAAGRPVYPKTRLMVISAGVAFK